MKRCLRPDRLVVLLLLALAVGVVLVLPAGRVFGSEYGDLPSQFVPWRAFAAASLRSGHLPLWNPYTYSGEPFLGGFQSAVLYPLNLIFLGLPLARAINLSILVHLVILAWGMFRWGRQRGLHEAAAALGGVALVLSGVVYPHIYAGHLSNICTMAWAPWILGGLEGWWSGRRRAGLFEASAAICLQILAGHVQYVFLTGIAAGLHAVAASVAEPAVRRRALPAVAGCYAAAALLSAAQLFPGFAAVGESARQGQTFALASIFSFPFENLVTAVAPGFFGDHLHNPYWGRWYIQEMSGFAGVAGVMLALIGACDSPARQRAWRDLAAGLLLFLLALGANTPLYRPLFDYVPGFGVIRGMSKFTFPAMIFLLLAAGAGADTLIRRQPVRRGLAAGAFVGALILVAAGLLFLQDPARVSGYMRSWQHVNQVALPASLVDNAGFVHDAGIRSGVSLLVAAGLFLLVGGSLWGLRRWPVLRWAPLVILGGEMAVFAWTNSVAAPIEVATPDGAKEFIARNPGDYRVLTLLFPSGFDGGFLLGSPDLWGNDPFLLGRYAEFMTFTQGGNPNQVGQVLHFKTTPALYTMLRCRYTFSAMPDGHVGAYPAPLPPMARTQLISDYRVLRGRDAIFSALSRPDFDPRRTVLLENEPSPRPVPSAEPGTVHAVETSPDTLVIEADVKAPSLLLVTDPYSRGWRAEPLAGSAQESYQILPANYILRAVPLSAGHHHILMEFVPPFFHLGVAVSLLAWLGWAGAAGVAARQRNPAAP